MSLFPFYKISKKVATWKLLSTGGKLTLIKVVLSSTPLHILAVLKPTKVVIDQIEKIFSQFFWGDKEGKSKMIWIKWSRITNLKRKVD